MVKQMFIDIFEVKHKTCERLLMKSYVIFNV